MTEEIIWKDPPPRTGRGQTVWMERLSPLVDNPNRWAMVCLQKSANVTSYLKQGRYKIPKGEWEFRSHKLEDGQWEIYARYLGPTGEGES